MEKSVNCKAYSMGAGHWVDISPLNNKCQAVDKPFLHIVGHFLVFIAKFDKPTEDGFVPKMQVLDISKSNLEWKTLDSANDRDQ